MWGSLQQWRAMDQPSRKDSAWTLMKTCQIRILKHHRSPPRIHEVSLGSMRVSFLTINIDLYPCCLTIRTHAFHCLHPAAARMVLTGLAWSRDLWKIRVFSSSVISTTFTLVLGNTENRWTLLGCVAGQVFCWPMWTGTSCPSHPALTRPFTGHLPPLALCLPWTLPGLLVLRSQPSFI